MNIWLSLDAVENRNVENIRTKIKAIEDLNEMEYPFYFKVLPSHIGTKVVFVCEGLQIEQDVTNYTSW